MHQEIRESAGGVIVGPDGRIVLVEQHGNSWSLPKGGKEEGEHLEETARREIKEETGLFNLTLIDVLGTYDRFSIGKDGVGESRELPLGRRTFFLFSTEETILTSSDEEITQLKWVSIDEALALLTHPKDREFLSSIAPRVQQVHNLVD